MQDPEIYTFEGLRYRAIKCTTLQNDYYVMRQLKLSGLHNITPNKSESAEDFAMRLMGAVIENGIPLQLLGGLIIPEEKKDKDWCPEMAEATAQWLGNLTDVKDKEKVQAIIIAVITDFFQQGLRFLNVSQNALTKEATMEGSGAQPEKQNSAPNS
jgi:hypothetical protein